MSERTREYDKSVGNLGDWVRVRFTTDRGQMIRYVVQYEVWYEERHCPALRDDNARGFPHRDTLDWSGETIAKDLESAAPIAESFTNALAEVEANSSRFHDEFLRRKP